MSTTATAPPNIEDFKLSYPEYSSYPDMLLRQWLALALAKKPITRDKDVIAYACYLYMAWLASVKTFASGEAEMTKGRDITLSQKSLGDRSESFISGNQLAAMRLDPRGYKACWDELMSTLKGSVYIASIGPGHLRR